MAVPKYPLDRTVRLSHMLTIQHIEFETLHSLPDVWLGPMPRDGSELQLLQAEGRYSSFGIATQCLLSISSTFVVVRRHVAVCVARLSPLHDCS